MLNTALWLMDVSLTYIVLLSVSCAKALASYTEPVLPALK